MGVATAKETRNMRTLKEEKNRMLDVCGSNVTTGNTSKTLIVSSLRDSIFLLM